MKQITSKITYFLAAAALLSVGVAQAQTHLQTTIPFGFTVGSEYFPSGDYRVDMDPMFHRVVLSGANGETRFLGVHVPIQGKAGSEAAFVFHRYGDRYFLHEVRNVEGLEGCQWKPARAEKDMAKAGAPPAEDVAIVAGTR